LEKQKQKKRITGTLDVAFKKRFFSMTAEGEVEGTFETPTSFLSSFLKRTERY